MDLFKEQELLGKEIQRIIVNFKKDSSDRKTKEYFEKRLNALEENWIKFAENDQLIIHDSSCPLNSAYITENYFHSIQQLYEEYQDLFKRSIKRLTDDESSVQNVPGTSKQLLDQGFRTIVDPVDKETSYGGATQRDVETRPSCESKVNDLEVIRLMRRQVGIFNSLQRLLSGLVIDNQSHQYLEMKYNVINQYWAQASEIHHTIWGCVDDPSSVGYKLNEFVRFEEEVQTILIKISEKRMTLSRDSAMNNNNDNGNRLMKLPQITIPQFDGDYLKWAPFHDLFFEMVHKQPMAKCQKLWYLKSNLSGEADRLIRHLSSSDDNYDIAWSTLCDRYSNRRLQVTALLNKLLSQPSHSTEVASSHAVKLLHDTTNECLMGLKALKIDTTNWDPLLLHMVIRKLDRATHALYEQQLTNPKELQSMEEFLRFLESRFQSLESLGSKGKPVEILVKKGTYQRPVTSMTATTSIKVCAMCKETHCLFQCKEFLKLSQKERLNSVKKHKLCINCLKPGHNAAQCSSRGCTKCNKRHNTLLHLEDSIQESSGFQRPNAVERTSLAASGLSEQLSIVDDSSNDQKSGYVLLSTAKVRLSASNGRSIECRALLDSGSMSNFVSERVLRKLNVSPSFGNATIEGIGGTTQKSNKRISLVLHSRVNKFTVRLESTVLPQITSPQPTRRINTSNWKIPKNIQLADPEFSSPEHIDCLLGMEHYYDLLSVGQIKLSDNLPTLQNTMLGWVIGGKILDCAPRQVTCGISCDGSDLNDAIEKFWKVEELEEGHTSLTPTEKHCERYFKETTRINAEGRFVVRLPFISSPTELGDSKDVALRRFFALERKLSRDPELKQQYVKFMGEYLQLGHMEPVNFKSIQAPYYFLPHHCVLKPDSSTTKLRVVFDASTKTTSNISLNNIIAAGPTIQDDLFTILLRFRLPRFVFTADIQKMYRQILINEDERKFQLILWRNDPDETLKTYQLRTVTYGTTSAPYLSIKCLQTLATESEGSHLLGSKILATNCYVDDIMTGCNKISMACDMQHQLQDLLQRRGFVLKKWCANHPLLLKNIPLEDQESCIKFNDQNEEYIKTLGLMWLPKTDRFGVKIEKLTTDRITKRYLASNIARLFDPLGIMAPVIVAAKIMLQKLWKLQLDWDAAVPMELHSRWIAFQNGLDSLQSVQFPRHIFDHKVSKSRQFHVFCDASEKAYGAAVYVRSKNEDRTITVNLLCSKSRVAPIKQINLPRLELCAAKLAVELARRVRKDIKDEDASVYFWTDSEIVLNWINSTSSSFHTFVANRIAEIQRLSDPEQWRHVRSKDNPADVVSRGMPPEKLKSCTIWFYGPAFLYGDESLWPSSFIRTSDEVLERKKNAVSTITSATQLDVQQVTHHLIDRINHKGSIRKMQRIIAYILRFVDHTRHKVTDLTSMALTPRELNQSLTIIIKHIQQGEFSDDLQHLLRYKEVSKGSSLATLTPFLDENGIIRVGGRLEASLLSFDAKHPMLLPYAHPITKIIMSEIHRTNRHIGSQTLLSLTRQQYWPIKGKTIARSVVQNCVICARAQPKLLSQIMGQLPSRRVQPSRPFVNAGVDFCGPFWTHYRIRGKRPQKSYIAVFCCFATKAVHFEVVSDLTTNAFLGALKRFISRRGSCQNLHCDNATNFVGARNQLEELKDNIYSEKATEKIVTFCNTKNIHFRFIPPRAPHFGGLWEAAVKSAKHLMVRSLSSASLTYEELETVIVEIEAILNSRPLTAMSEDPNDLAVLTPGHFLIGEPLTAPVDPNSVEEKASLTSRWKLVTYIKNNFWNRWSNEYLHELQHRYKWKHRKDSVQPGTIVVIKEDNTPVMKWPLGRIVETFKGDDGCVRVADVKTASGVFRRSIHRLAPLPVDDEVGHLSEVSSTQKRNHGMIGEESSQMIPEEIEREHQPLIKRKRSGFASTLLHVLLAMCIILPSGNCDVIKVTQFDSRPGLHFEGVGSIRVISDEWHLITYYDLNPYWTEFTALESGLNVLKSLCNHVEQKQTCTPIIAQFEHVLHELTAGNELLRPEPITNRSRRGALDFVGNVAHSLFGVLDSEYARKMADTIRQVNMNENHLVQVLKNQTSIIDSTVNVMKKEQSAVVRKFQTLDKEFTALIQTFNKTNEMTFQLRSQQIFTIISIELTIILSNLQRVQSEITTVLTDMHEGKVNPSLLTPNQIKKEVTTIRNHLPPLLQIPIFKENNIAQLYKVMKIEGRLVENQFIFQVRIPLLKVEKFDLFRIFPIPGHLNKTMAAILPSYEFIAVDQYRDEFYPITEQEINKCLMPVQQLYLCDRKHPVYRKGGQLKSCEMDLFSGKDTSPDCKLEIIDNGAIWIQLSHPNQWIFAMKLETIITYVCDLQTSTITIQGSGILTIAPSCIVKQDMMTIQGHHIYSSDIHMSYTKFGTFSQVPTLERIKPSLPTSGRFTTQSEELDAILERLAEQKIDLPTDVKLHNHHIAVGYIALAMAMIAVITITGRLVWKYVSKKGVETSIAPEPAPRSHSTKDLDFTITANL